MMSELIKYIFVTKHCNMSCKYCNMRNDNSSVNPTLEDIKSHLDEVENVAIFSGGEPTLNFNLIKEAITYLENTKDHAIDYVLQTNLVHITDEMLEYIDEKRIKVEVSLDGHRATNQMRVLIHKEQYNSYNYVVENLKKIKENYPDIAKEMSVHSVIHPYNITHMSKMLKHNYKLGFRDMMFTIVEVPYPPNVYFNDSFVRRWAYECSEMVKFVADKNINVNLFNGSELNWNRENMSRVTRDDTSIDCDYLPTDTFHDKMYKKALMIYKYINKGDNNE